MRRLITGVDADGRSCVVKETALDQRDAGVDVHSLFRTTSAPPPARPPGRGELRDLGVAPGHVQWLVSHWMPGEEAAMHHTDTVDFDLVVRGTMDLTLDDGVHHLEAGDAVVMTGVDHAWRAGPDGCTMSVLLLGSLPPAA